MNSSRTLVCVAIFVAFATPSAPSRAVIGAAADDRFAGRVAMVLTRAGSEAGFCSALVLDSRTLLTAAHCLRPTGDMAVHYRKPSGEPVVIPIDAAVAHPLFHADAIRSRVVSVDVALIRTASPLGPRFTGAALASGAGPAVGDRVILSGYGAARDGDWKSGGELRSVTLSVREPASNVLIWAADPDRRVAGACSGDSGAPLWSSDGNIAVAIAAWAQAPHGPGCGGLTQGPRLAPLKAWIEETARRLARVGGAQR